MARTKNQKKKILIVEDDVAMSKALSFKLASEGFAIKTLFNGENVVPRLKDERFDLVLLDLIMPKMDGWQVFTRVRVEHLDTPIMVISNLSDELDIKRARELGAKRYFVKANITLAQIVEEIKRFFRISK